MDLISKLGLFFLIVFSHSALAQSDTTVAKQKTIVGFEIDALPYISGGYYASMWFGNEKQKIRYRPILAKVNLPDFLLEEQFSRNTIQVYAFVVDYFFKPDFEGFWVAPGMEYWEGEIENNMGETSDYNEWIMTMGGGYVWKFWGNLYVNPWVAGHIHLAGDKEVIVGDDLFETAFFTPEISIKIGWHF